MDRYDIVIKDGLIVDGMRTPAFRGDIGVRDGVIAAIGRVRSSDASQVIDATGLVVAPGFVDLHTHYDAQVFWDPYCSMSGWHGATTVMVGNCGYGLAPVPPAERERVMLSLQAGEQIPVECMQDNLPWDWETFPEYLDSVERTPKAVNVASLLPLNQVLIAAMGEERAKSGELPTDEEHATMRRLLREALLAGAHGFSASHELERSAVIDYDGKPFPTQVMRLETGEVLAEEMGEHNTGYIQWAQLPYGWDLAFVERMAISSGRPLVLPGFGAERAAEMRRRGLRIFNNSGVNPAAVNNMVMRVDSLRWDVPAWTEAFRAPLDGPAVDRLSDPSLRERLGEQVPARVLGMVVVGGHSAMTEAYEGRRLVDIAAELGANVSDVVCDLLVADGGRTEFSPVSDVEAAREAILDEYTLDTFTDGGAHQTLMPSGSELTGFLAGAVRDRGWLSLEDAHWRLSAFPAGLASFSDRGTLAEGQAADVIVYDLERLRPLPSTIERDRPGGQWRRVAKAEGYRHILVNGEVVIEDDKETGCNAGQLLRSGTAKDVTP